MKTTRISLSFDDFKTLIKGKVVKYDNVEIALSDIGFDKMISSILVEYRKIENLGDENPGI